MENGRSKLLRKGADAIIVNTVTGDGVGIEADSNAATFLTLTTSIELHEMPKRLLADRILDEILTLRRPRPVVLELDEHADERMRQDEVLAEAANASANRRPMIVE
jgi:phosphopantothenoylcysteine decarboxylase/phosphopantothenate--cysteine ligase